MLVSIDETRFLYLSHILKLNHIFSSSPNPFLKGSSARKSKISRNRDPGVESDDEDFEGDLGDDDDMFR